MPQSKHTFIDLFSGCGGLSLGFELADYTSILAIDNWQDALDTYEYNNHNARTLCADLSKLDPYKIKAEYDIDKVSVIIGGPPCQGFSIAGKRIIDDERNKLYKSFVAFVRCFMPDAFVMENVPNILSIGNGVVKESILSDFQELGYNVSYKILLASDYGVPQNRRRAVFVGLKKWLIRISRIICPPQLQRRMHCQICQNIAFLMVEVIYLHLKASINDIFDMAATHYTIIR